MESVRVPWWGAVSAIGIAIGISGSLGEANSSYDFTYSGAFRADAEIHGVCNGVMGVDPHEPFTFRLTNASLDTFHTQWNETVVRSASQNPMTIYVGDFLQERTQTDLPDGEYAIMDAGERARIRVLPPGWPDGGSSPASVPLTISGIGMDGLPPENDGFRDYYLVPNESQAGTAIPYYGGVAADVRRIGLVNGSIAFDGAGSLLVEDVNLAGPNGPRYLTPSRERTPMAPVTGLVDEYHIDDVYGVIRADHIAFQFAVSGTAALCAELNYAADGSMTAFLASGQIWHETGHENFTRQEVTVAGTFAVEERVARDQAGRFVTESQGSGRFQTVAVDFVEVPEIFSIPPAVATTAGGAVVVLLIGWFFSRFSRGRILSHEARARIIDAVANNPRIGQTAIAKQLDMRISTLRYHLRRLEEHKEIIRLSGSRPRFICPDVNETHGVLADSVLEHVKTVAVSGPVRKARAARYIAAQNGWPRSTAWYHLNKRITEGTIKEVEGRTGERWVSC